MPVRLFVRSIVLLATVALALFVVGPQAGSVDDDDDGYPDIPVVVSNSVVFAQEAASSQVDQRSRSIDRVVLSGHLGVSSPHIDSVKSHAQSIDNTSLLRCCCSLRC